MRSTCGGSTSKNSIHLLSFKRHDNSRQLHLSAPTFTRRDQGEHFCTCPCEPKPFVTMGLCPAEPALR
eukprot:4617294-Pleurochrysis_carterae.AAC.1